MPEQGLKMELHGNKLLILKKIKKFSTWVLIVLKERTIIPVFRSFYIKYGEKNTGSQFVTQYFLILFFA